MGVASPSSLNDAKAFKRSRIRSLTCEEYLEIVNAENDMTRESASERIGVGQTCGARANPCT